MKSFNFIVDNLTLQGWLHLPDNHPCPNFVIGSHGLLSTGASPKQIALANALNALGVAYIRFDHRGVGQSMGDFAVVTTLQNRTRDLLAVYEYARDNFDLGPKLGLFGSSLGGATCINAFAQLKPAAVVSIAAPLASADILPRGNYTDPNLKFFQNSSKSFDLRQQLKVLNHILIIHGTADEIVPCAHGQQIYDAAKEPKQLLLLGSSDHTISAPKHQKAFINAAVSWYKQYLR